MSAPDGLETEKSGLNQSELAERGAASREAVTSAFYQGDWAAGEPGRGVEGQEVAAGGIASATVEWRLASAEGDRGEIQGDD
jgi:hypothetical protein